MKPLRVGVAGLGTVGAGVLKLLEDNGTEISARCGRAITVTAVSARDRGRDRGVDLTPYEWHDDAVALATAPDVDVVVELIGGSEGVAKDLAEAAIAGGKSFVTANKALIARHGTALARAAEEAGSTLRFEAAVAGGVPIISALQDGLAANRRDYVFGIFNGTCNYILTEMESSGRDFDEVLREAQEKGYAEADPSFDVDGVDTAHKLAILTALALGAEVDFEAIHVEGIRDISAIDIQYAAELGYRIKLLGIGRLTEHGLEQTVHPAMVPLKEAIAHVGGVVNAVVVEGSHVGRMMMEGEGAGEGPTASAVVADIISIARGVQGYSFGIPAKDLRRIEAAPIERHQGAYYFRLVVIDQPGVVADIAAILRDENVSLASLIQRGRAPGEPVSVVFITHVTDEASMKQALERMQALDSVIEPFRMIRIKDL